MKLCLAFGYIYTDTEYGVRSTEYRVRNTERGGGQSPALPHIHHIGRVTVMAIGLLTQHVRSSNLGIVLL